MKNRLHLIQDDLKTPVLTEEYRLTCKVIIAFVLALSWLVAYIFCLRDTGISMLVYPPGSDPLTVRIFTLMANGEPAMIAALCVLLVVVSLVPFGVIQWVGRYNGGT